MRTINETFTDEEFNTLLDIKGKMSWHDFIMQLSGENNAPNTAGEKLGEAN